MKELIEKTIILLKIQIKNNLETINHNQARIREISTQPKSAKSNSDLDDHYTTNNRLLSENNDFINIQLALMNFLDKYKDSPVMKDAVPALDINTIASEEELFERTIAGVIQYNQAHPYFNDKKFYFKLMKFYQDREEYEKCQELSMLKMK